MLRGVDLATERFLGQFAADVLLSQERPLRRIALDILCAQDVHGAAHLHPRSRSWATDGGD
jgi:hypothetical protein